MAVRQIKSARFSPECLIDTGCRSVITGAPFLVAPTALSSKPTSMPLRDSPDAITLFLGKWLLLFFIPLRGTVWGGTSPLLFLRCPLLTSPLLSLPVARHLVSCCQPTAMETSRGKTRHFRCASAKFTKCIQLPQMEGFAVTCPLAPDAPRLISGFCSSPRPKACHKPLRQMH